MYGLHIIKAPSGRYVFVGRVPACLAIEASSADLVEVAQMCGMTIAQRRAERQGGYIRARSWPTAEAARQEAELNSYSVMSSVE